jgi:hypothetical protein
VVETPPLEISPSNSSLNVFLSDSLSVENGILFLNECKYIYTFNVNDPLADPARLTKSFYIVENFASRNSINIESTKNEYIIKISQIQQYYNLK